MSPGISRKTFEVYSRKRSFCGRCIQTRLHRGDIDWDFDKEFAYNIPAMTEEEKEKLQETLDVLCRLNIY